MNLLVTGGAGFIGSNLANRLAAEGHTVTAADNLFLGLRENLKPAVAFSEMSVTDFDALEALFKKQRFEYVFHLAAISSAPMYSDGKAPHPATWTDVNITGFANILKLAAEYGTQKVIYASTSSLYSGNPLPYREDQRIEPKTMYEATLYARELLAYAFSKTHNLSTVGFRYFSVYGYNERHKGSYANLVSQFVWALQAGKQPVVYGDGSQTRDFIFIDDVVAANLLAMRTAMDGVYNVGTGIAHSVNDLLRMLSRIMGKACTPVYITNPLKNYVTHTLADTSKTARAGFAVNVTLEEGISRLLAVG